MRTSRNIFIFTIINLICGIVFINFLPQNVIFGFLGNFYSTQLINKWYNLIIPIIQVVCIFIIFVIDIVNTDKVHKYRYLTAWVAISFTTFVMWTLMFMQYYNIELGKITYWPLSIIILLPISLFLLAEGYYIMSKDMDDFSLFAIRGVKDNPDAWRKVHSFAGKMAIIVGVVLFVLAVVNELLWHTNWIYLVALLVWLVFYYLLTLVYALSFKE